MMSIEYHETDRFTSVFCGVKSSICWVGDIDMDTRRKLTAQTEDPVLYSCSRDRDLPPGIRFGPVIFDHYVIECNTGGYGSVIIKGKEFPVRPGDCYMILPGYPVTYTTDFKEPRSGVYCHVGGLKIGRAFTQAGITAEQPYAPPELFSEITAQVEKLYTMSGDTDIGAEYRRTGCLYNILGILLRDKTATDKNVWVRKAMGYMDAYYFEDLTVESIANAIGLDRSYFSTLFKSCTGQSPHAYLTSLRIKRAEVLMREYDYSVANAAEAVGLDARNFARLFKRETGQTPLQLKQKRQ